MHLCLSILLYGTSWQKCLSLGGYYSGRCMYMRVYEYALPTNWNSGVAQGEGRI